MQKGLFCIYMHILIQRMYLDGAICIAFDYYLEITHVIYTHAKKKEGHPNSPALLNINTDMNML